MASEKSGFNLVWWICLVIIIFCEAVAFEVISEAGDLLSTYSLVFSFGLVGMAIMIVNIFTHNIQDEGFVPWFGYLVGVVWLIIVGVQNTTELFHAMIGSIILTVLGGIIVFIVSLFTE